MPLPKGFDLEGWQSIAEHLGCSKSTAEAAASRADDANPLPVVRGYLGRVIAKKAELDAWGEREVTKASRAGRVVRSASKANRGRTRPLASENAA